MKLSEFAQNVHEFDQVFNLKFEPGLRLALILEELGEVVNATLKDYPKNDIAKEIGDLLYVIIGYADTKGLTNYLPRDNFREALPKVSFNLGNLLSRIVNALNNLIKYSNNFAPPSASRDIHTLIESVLFYAIDGEYGIEEAMLQVSDKNKKKIANAANLKISSTGKILKEPSFPSEKTNGD